MEESEANQTLASLFAFTLLGVEVVLKLLPVLLLPIATETVVIYPGSRDEHSRDEHSRGMYSLGQHSRSVVMVSAVMVSAAMPCTASSRLVPPRPVTHSKHPQQAPTASTHSKHPQQARPHQPALPCTPPPLCPGSNHSAPTTDAGGDKSLSVSNLIIASTYSVVAVGAVVLMRAIQDVDALQQPPAHAGPGDEPLLVPLLKRRKCSLYKASAATRLWSARAASDPGSSPHPNPNPSSNPSSNPHPAPTPHQVPPQPEP